MADSTYTYHFVIKCGEAIRNVNIADEASAFLILRHRIMLWYI